MDKHQYAQIRFELENCARRVASIGARVQSPDGQDAVDKAHGELLTAWQTIRDAEPAGGFAAFMALERRSAEDAD